MTIPIQLRIEEKTFDTIKRMARYKAVEMDNDIQWQDLVREAIYNTFPVPVESDDNGSKKNSSQCI